MKLAGVQSRSSWKEQAVSNVFSAALMAGFVNSLKYNPQIEMFAHFKTKSSFHKTKGII